MISANQNQNIEYIQQQRVRDMLHLAQSKQQNLEETLKALNALQNKLTRHHDLDTQLEIHSRNLFQLTKESAILAPEASEMERFETFESIISPFLRMQILESEAEEYRRAGKELMQQVRNIEELIDQYRKSLSQSIDSSNSAQIQHNETCAILETVNRLDGKKHAYETCSKMVREHIAKAKDDLSAIRNKISDAAIEIQDNENILEQLKAERHSLESHETMLEHAELIISHLKRLQELSDELSILSSERNRNTHEQSLQNETLSQIYSKYNDINQQIQAVQDEAGVHRTSIRGLVSYDIQERVLKLKSRLQMLLAAQSLWRRIHSGYIRIEEKTQLINSLRLDIEHDLKAEQELTIRVNLLKRQVREKEYSLNMSKSQDVIQLRANLTEGEACTVCGATHHPFHSDTMLDQSKLIGDIRSEYESLSGELEGQTRQMDMLHDKLTKSLGQQIAEQQNLNVVIQRQDEDVKEWQVFALLDSTFADCSPSTDGEGRMATLRQLIDNTQRDVKTAEEELSIYIYHSSQIDILSEKIVKLDEQKDEITVRMSEVNTACQVLAVQAEQADNRLKNIQERYHQQYELVNGEISIPDWYSMWEHNADRLRTHISNMSAKWNSLKLDIPRQKNKRDNAIAIKDMLQLQERDAVALLEILTSNEQSLSDKYETTLKQREDLLGRQSTGEVLEKSLNQLYASAKKLNADTQQLHDTEIRHNQLQGATDTMQQSSEKLDAKVSTQRSTVDLWIRAYNASHPPVQYAELSDLLTQDIDWNIKRKTIRENQMATQLEQQKVKQLESEIIALEVDTGPLTAQQTIDKQQRTAMQIEETEASLRSTMMQIAKLKIELGIN